MSPSYSSSAQKIKENTFTTACMESHNAGKKTLGVVTVTGQQVRCMAFTNTTIGVWKSLDDQVRVQITNVLLYSQNKI